MKADEGWSVNALHDVLGPDRRSIKAWLGRSGAKPIGNGPRGPLWRLRDAVAVLADAGLLGQRERWTRWGDVYMRKNAAGEFARELTRALRRLPSDAQRPALEALAESLRSWFEDCEAAYHEDEGAFERTPSPSWARMTERELLGALGKMCTRREPVLAGDTELADWSDDAEGEEDDAA